MRVVISQVVAVIQEALTSQTRDKSAPPAIFQATDNVSLPVIAQVTVKLPHTVALLVTVNQSIAPVVAVTDVAVISEEVIFVIFQVVASIVLTVELLCCPARNYIS